MPRGKKLRVIEAVRKHARSLVGQSAPIPSWLGKLQDRVVFLYWLVNHYSKFSPVKIYLNEAKADLVSILYALNLQLERTTYLHARSLLENLMRHCYYDSHLATFVGEHSNSADFTRKRWSELVQHVESLVYFRTIKKTDPAAKTSEHSETPSSEPEAEEDDALENELIDWSDEKLDLFGKLKEVYSRASNFIHSPTWDERSGHVSVQTVKLTDDRATLLSKFIRNLFEACVCMLCVYNIGAYQLIPQPIRRYLLEHIRTHPRVRLLNSLNELPIDWLMIQKRIALRTLRKNRIKPLYTREGLVALPSGITYLCV